MAQELNNAVGYFLAEVIETNIDDGVTPYDILFKRFSSDAYSGKASPANNSIKQLPLVNEHVLVFQAPNHFTSPDQYQLKWYYMPAIAMQDVGLNNTALGGTTVATANPDLNNTVPGAPAVTRNEPVPHHNKTVSILQPYEGDTILEGRHGARIRLGSTPDPETTARFQPGWSGENTGDPIIVLSTNMKEGGVTPENVEDDSSSIYLTSTQKISGIQFTKPLEKSNAPYKSQFIASADSVVIQAKKQSVVLDSLNRITLNTEKIYLGDESASHALVKGDVLKSVLTHIINAIQAGVIGPAGILSIPTPGTFDLSAARSKLNDLTNENVRMKGN